MELPVNRKVKLYSALFITAVVSLPRLLAMNRGGVLAKLTPFNPYQWILQVSISFGFCWLLFYLNSNRLQDFNKPWQFRKHGGILLYNLLVTFACALTAGVFSHLLFHRTGVYRLDGYMFRLLSIAFLIAVELKILASVYQVQLRDRENDSLRHANTMMELALLKTQLNPHFFFNALSSLSGVVREDPGKAQQYIAHLSRIFRYSFSKSKQSLVNLEEELNEIHAYGELMKMRHEEGFSINIQVLREYYAAQLPHMSLQPLVENALKHNLAARARPLLLEVSVENNRLVVKNNLQLKPFPEPGAGIGLSNLNDRFKILMGQELEVSSTGTAFLVRLPLKLL
ncbi:histidine kinase [Pseudoflavitalea sp. X16]|uniref:sensor histidine kinase n=1 Tax=Paraflavitalea devenefica TaxID=2716334 RepID=UPI00141E51D1|nr:histidine kinase [Paraflavitalea devenefica]NII29432.1 histidine kinase [Paraflavitalea devenefica]